MKTTIAIVLIIIVVIAIGAYLFLAQKPPVKQPAKTAEEQAYDLLEEELEQSLTNFTMEDVENLLLTLS